MSADFTEMLFAAIWTLALCGIFNGARRLASRKYKRDGLGELTVSLILAVGLAVASFIQYQSVIDLQIPRNALNNSEAFDKEVRAALDPDNENHRAMTYSSASDAFRLSGEIREYLTLDGLWVEYCPTEEDIRMRDKLITLQAEINWSKNEWRGATTYWIVPIPLALLLGLLTGGRGGRRGRED